VADALRGLAAVALGLNQARRATLLFAASQQLVDTYQLRQPKADRVEFEQNLAGARDQLGEAAFGVAWAEGRGMTLDEAVALALNT
jgi:hypothetical protein